MRNIKEIQNIMFEIHMAGKKKTCCSNKTRHLLSEVHWEDVENISQSFLFFFRLLDMLIWVLFLSSKQNPFC